MIKLKRLTALFVALMIVTGCSIHKDEGKKVRIDYGEGLYQINQNDDEDRLVRYEIYSGDELKYYTIIHYDENDRVTGTDTYTAEDTLDSSTKTEYDENGTEYTTVYDASGNITHKMIHEYYDNGNICRYEAYTIDEEVYRVVEYDENGERIHTVWYNTDGTVLRTEKQD